MAPLPRRRAHTAERARPAATPPVREVAAELLAAARQHHHLIAVAEHQRTEAVPSWVRRTRDSLDRWAPSPLPWRASGRRVAARECPRCHYCVHATSDLRTGAISSSVLSEVQRPWSFSSALAESLPGAARYMRMWSPPHSVRRAGDDIDKGRRLEDDACDGCPSGRPRRRDQVRGNVDWHLDNSAINARMAGSDGHRPLSSLSPLTTISVASSPSYYVELSGCQGPAIASARCSAPGVNSADNTRASGFAAKTSRQPVDHNGRHQQTILTSLRRARGPLRPDPRYHLRSGRPGRANTAWIWRSSPRARASASTT